MGYYQNGESIDIDRLIQAVRELAAERPDFVYKSDNRHGGPSCLYTLEDGTPDCIIGCAMGRIGQSLPPQKSDSEYNECELLNDGVCSDLWKSAFGVQRTDFRLKWLGVVQSEQDSGTTWAKAVAEADKSYPLS